MKINFRKICRLEKDSVKRLSIKQRIQRKLLGHVASCPCCQKRLALTNRVELAICLLKMQPQQSQLLANANSSALNILKHSLRYSPKSDTLRHARYGQGWAHRYKPILEHVLNMAACLFVLVMIRCGIFSSLSNYKDQGEAILHNYYAQNLDKQLFDEIFPDETLTS
jgi:hypothetical protein